MAKNKKRHSGSARTYQDLKRQKAQQKRALTNEALLPDKTGSRKISFLGAGVMLVVFVALFFFTQLTVWSTAIISLICGMTAVMIATYFSIRRNREKRLREMGK